MSKGRKANSNYTGTRDQRIARLYATKKNSKKKRDKWWINKSQLVLEKEVSDSQKFNIAKDAAIKLFSAWLDTIENNPIRKQMEDPSNHNKWDKEDRTANHFMFRLQTLWNEQWKS